MHWHTTMLNDAGEIIDDVVIFRMDEDRFWISTLFASRMDGWFYDRQGDDDPACRACGNPAYPECMDSCPLFDDCSWGA